MAKRQVKAPESVAETRKTSARRWRTVKTKDGRTMQIAIIKKGTS